MTLALEPRRSFTPHQREAIYASQEGRCALCPSELRPGWQIDHRVPLAFHGAHQPENWRGLCVPCHAEITRAQAPKFAKVRRILKWSEPKKPSRIRNRGFSTTLRRTFSGRVERT